MAFALAGRPFRTSAAGVGILACLLMVTLCALLGSAGNSMIVSSPHHGSTVSAVPEVHLVGSGVAEGCGSGHEVSHWRHTDPTIVGVAPQAAGTSSSALGVIVSLGASLPTVSPDAASASLTPVLSLLCVLRT